MASPFKIRTTVPTLTAAAVCAVALMSGATDSAFAHQVTNANGTVVPHQHAYKRSSYGNGYLRGHVAPTPHGNNMIIWSPAPTDAYGNVVPQMHISRPDRHSRLHQQRDARQSPDRSREINKPLRQLNQRDDQR